MSDQLELYELPDGERVATGCLLPTQAELVQCMADYRLFGESNYLDPKDIERLLPREFHKKRRKERSHRMINQASLGKCNASATIHAAHQIRELTGQEPLDRKNIVLSDCHLYMNINGGRDQGSLLNKGMERIRTNGMSPRSLQRDGKSWMFPTDVYARSQVDPFWLRVADEEAKNFIGFEPMVIPDNWGDFVPAMSTAIAREYPIIIAWHVGNNGMRLTSGHGGEGYAINSNGPGNHATVVHSGKYVGGRDCVHGDLMNTWGPVASADYGPRSNGWGEGGFGLLTMESLFQCRKNHVFWVFVSISENPKDKIL